LRRKTQRHKCITATGLPGRLRLCVLLTVERGCEINLAGEEVIKVVNGGKPGQRRHIHNRNILVLKQHPATNKFFFHDHRMDLIPQFFLKFSFDKLVGKSQVVDHMYHFQRFIDVLADKRQRTSHQRIMRPFHIRRHTRFDTHLVMVVFAGKRFPTPT
jgi:hypothetical protein